MLHVKLLQLKETSIKKKEKEMDCGKMKTNL